MTGDQHPVFGSCTENDAPNESRGAGNWIDGRAIRYDSREMPRKRPTIDVLPRLRVMQGDVILLGPGKADLLEAIGREGSIRAAAEALGMSYMRAWSLVRTMNEAFREPLVESTRGGGGGATLTREGTKVLALYRDMQQRALRAVAPLVKELAGKV